MGKRSYLVGVVLSAFITILTQQSQAMMVVNQTEDQVRQSTFSEKLGGRWTGALVTFELSHFQDSPNGVARTYSAKVVTIHTPHAQTTFSTLHPEGTVFSFQGTPLSPFAGMIREPGQLYLGFFKTDNKGAPILMSMKAARVEAQTAANGDLAYSVMNVWKPEPVREKYINLSGQTRYSVGPATRESLDGFVTRMQASVGQ